MHDPVGAMSCGIRIFSADTIHSEFLFRKKIKDQEKEAYMEMDNIDKTEHGYE